MVIIALTDVANEKLKRGSIPRLLLRSAKCLLDPPASSTCVLLQSLLLYIHIKDRVCVICEQVLTSVIRKLLRLRQVTNGASSVWTQR